MTGRRLARFGLLTALALGAAAALLPAAGFAADSPYLEFTSSRRNRSIIVPTGKSENIRTDISFVDVVVGDAEIADVVPLTDRSLSILGKKIGTTRVSVYGEGKRLAGVFDVEVAYDTTRLGAELARRFPYARFHVSSVNGRILLSGDSPDAVTLDKAITIAKQFGPDVINSVSVSQPQQVMLEVRFIEVQRSAARELGVNWDVATQNMHLATGMAGMIGITPAFGTFIGSMLKKGVSADVLIKALEERDMARRLAEPNLVALSGDTASFLAGGEFPFPVAAQLGQITVEWKRFGVGLAFTPTVLSNGLINIKIEPEVSQLDPTTTIKVAEITLPSLIVRRANTTVELRDGQSFAIAGLLQNNGSTAQKQLPWLGDVPVLGALFRSAQYQKKETDLVIIITPRLVHPMRPGDPQRTPLDNTLPANDGDFFLGGQAELTTKMQRQLAGRGHPLSGHILDLPPGAIHVSR